MIIRNVVPPIILATILGFVSAVAADAKPITEAEKKHCASAYHQYCGEYGSESAGLRHLPYGPSALCRSSPSWLRSGQDRLSRTVIHFAEYSSRV